jgi:methylmalonyl-CoA/ethylmalonyl-CoA epimerase
MSPNPAPTQAITSIGQVAITVRQLSRAVEFYRDTLGLTFLFEAGHMAFFDCGGVRLMLSFSDNAESTYNSILYYRTANIQEASAQLIRKGVQFEAEPRLIAKMPDHDLWMAFLRDSEGNLLALMSEVSQGKNPGL